MGLTFMPVMATATTGVAPHDSGVTSATVNTAQQVGGSIGTALLNTIATSTSATYIAGLLAEAARRGEGQGLTPAMRDGIARAGVVHGFTVAIGVGSAIMLLAALVAGVMVNVRAPRQGQGPVPATGGAASATR